MLSSLRVFRWKVRCLLVSNILPTIVILMISLYRLQKFAATISSCAWTSRRMMNYNKWHLFLHWFNAFGWISIPTTTTYNFQRHNWLHDDQCCGNVNMYIFGCVCYYYWLKLNLFVRGNLVYVEIFIGNLLGLKHFSLRFNDFENVF